MHNEVGRDQGESLDEYYLSPFKANITQSRCHNTTGNTCKDTSHGSNNTHVNTDNDSVFAVVANKVETAIDYL